MNDKKFTVCSKSEITLTQQDIDDIMVTALEGGINYWCREAEVMEEKRCGSWGHEQIARGGVLILHDAESSNEWELTLERFLNGVKLYFEQGNHVQVDAGRIDAGKIDSTDADCIIQLALFGEIVFG